MGGPIIRHTDGDYYAIVNLHTSTTAPTYNYVCLIRTDDLDDPSSWRAWDGAASAADGEPVRDRRAWIRVPSLSQCGITRPLA